MRYMSDQEIDRLSGAAGKRLAAEPKVEIVIAPAEGGQDVPWEGGLNGYFFRLAALIRENERVAELSRAQVRAYSAGRGKRLGP